MPNTWSTCRDTHRTRSRSLLTLDHKRYAGMCQGNWTHCHVWVKLSDRSGSPSEVVILEAKIGRCHNHPAWFRMHQLPYAQWLHSIKVYISDQCIDWITIWRRDGIKTPNPDVLSMYVTPATLPWVEVMRKHLAACVRPSGQNMTDPIGCCS